MPDWPLAAGTLGVFTKRRHIELGLMSALTRKAKDRSKATRTGREAVDMARQRKQQEAEAACRRAQVTGLPAEVAGLPADVAGLPAEVAGLPADVAGLPAEVAGLPADVAGLPAQEGEDYRRYYTGSGRTRRYKGYAQTMECH